MPIQNKIHFIHLEFIMSPSYATTIAEWATRSPAHTVYLWTMERFMAIAMESVMDALSRSVVGAMREHFKVITGTRSDGTLRDERIEAHVPPFGNFKLYIRRLENYEDYFPRRLVRDEVYRWQNLHAARRLIKFAILHMEGGYVLEPHVRLKGNSLPPLASAPRGILFYMHPGEPPVFTDDVVAAKQHSQKALEILGMFTREYARGDYADDGDEYVLSPEGDTLLHEMAERRREIREFHRAGTVEEASRQRALVDEQLMSEMQRTQGRSGVSVLNQWAHEREELLIDEVDILAEQYVFVEKTPRDEFRNVQQFSMDEETGLCFVEDYFAETPEPELRMVQKRADAEFLLYSLEDMLGIRLRMTVECAGELTSDTPASSRSRGTRFVWRHRFEVL